MTLITRRNLIVAGAGSLLAGCDRVGKSEAGRDILFKAEAVHRSLQRVITNRNALAREFSPDDLSPRFRANGTRSPRTPEYMALAANRFSDWRLRVDGLVARPLSLSLADLRAMPQRAQITRHDCVEGWSAIGKWQGPKLSAILDAAGLRDSARYLVFHCADSLRGGAYYESIDLIDAFHPQTILAWAMNDRILPIAHGAPVRLRVERQLGYKHAKYVMRVEAVVSLEGIGRGKGGYWEDVADYEWYAGI
ncbi:DMSO/TMAO reductase YedYZ molybdopterin-dependent catalytic subunit [Sphingomonas sp. BE123]|uniref:molybdopterin-binding protein n=1 Tax=Sphingomonas sp. BE123 TaxID=2817842 RepID=UPI00285443DD|nr:molybdopterin-binding protein [Sphingomonas sp. BE123]MDR6852915.1 DMSO/TMAO reductase YedYZ molybdopterin-dependent catalytic subunit [Sphingomonas sp. BE123]